MYPVAILADHRNEVKTWSNVAELHQPHIKQWYGNGTEKNASWLLLNAQLRGYQLNVEDRQIYFLSFNPNNIRCERDMLYEPSPQKSF